MFSLQIGEAPASMGSATHWMDLVASLVSSLAWPVAVVLVALMFRGPITAILKKIRKFAIGNVSVEISDSLEQAETILQSEETEATIDPQPDSAEKMAASKLPPDYVVINEWRSIEMLIRKIGKLNGVVVRAPTRVILKKLAALGIIRDSTFELISELSSIRNKVAHGEAEVSPPDSLRYFDLARGVKTDLARTVADPENTEKNLIPPS